MLIGIDIDPIAFTIGAQTIRWYGIMVALGVLAVILYSIREIDRQTDLPQPPDPYVIIVAILSGMAVSKAFHVADQWEYYSQHPEQIFSGAGLAIYGAVLGATLSMWIYSRIRKYNFGYFADIIAPSILLGQAIGRVGCFLNGCCFGNTCEINTVSGPHLYLVYTHPNSYAPIGVPVLATQVYEIIFCLTMFIVLHKLKFRLKPEGSVFLIYLASYSAWRVAVGFMRQGDPFVFGLLQAQFIGIVVIAVTIPMLIIGMRRYRANKNQTA
jgi:phosphatidylglycerol:prolipoprotein diacylglycerol transferase